MEPTSEKVPVTLWFTFSEQTGLLPQLKRSIF